MSRKLATIQEIKEVLPIEGADRIQLAKVLGWEIVIRKDEYKPGDKCVYVETDSILPDKPEFEFMRSRKFRVKIIKLKGQVSMGICFPLSILPEKSQNLPLDTDVSEILGIVKYDPEKTKEYADTSKTPANPVLKYLRRYKIVRELFPVQKGKSKWPEGFAKTDEERIQRMPYICEKYSNSDVRFEVTSKLDGTSGTYILKRVPKFFGLLKTYEFYVCSRNLRLPHANNGSYWNMADKYKIKDVLIAHAKKVKAKSIVLQGEIIGPSIQKNKYKLSEKEFRIFNLIINGKKVSTEPMTAWCAANNLLHVPVLSLDFKILPTVNEMVEYANGKSTLNADTIREGVVIRNYDLDISFKCISPNFLLKND